MTTRPHALQAFVSALQNALSSRAGLPEEQTMLSRSFEALARPRDSRQAAGQRLPACRHLDSIAARAQSFPEDLHRLARLFFALEPSLVWRQRSGSMDGASDSFAEGHANALIVGPGGLERRTDVSVGVTILAPHVRYPDHTHPPEETYLILSPGRFSHDLQEAVEPGLGGTFYNAPGIVHSMESGNEPLFAFWILGSQER
ncbi:MAG: hypothetical protein BM562_08745 [Alphaproteobacteria bacterium MedPE-SWcel]|nr:MAG: hypothetical protein BM562_08745 [Alphaproteobacteria bacterium MedPE-SWcel]